MSPLQRVFKYQVTNQFVSQEKVVEYSGRKMVFSKNERV